MPRQKGRNNFHFSEVEDAARDWLRGVVDGDPRALEEPCTLEIRDGQAFASVAALARLTRRSRKVVHRRVCAKWLEHGRSQYVGSGLPIDRYVVEQIARAAGVDLDEAEAAITRQREEPAPLQRPDGYLAETLAPVLAAEAARMVSGEPSAFSFERSRVRFVCGEAAERAELHHLTLAHGIKRAGLWDPNAPRESLHTRKRLGRPLDARALLDAMGGKHLSSDFGVAMAAQHVDVEAFARALQERHGERERAKLPGRYALPSRAGLSAKRTEPDSDLIAFNEGFRQWLEREHKAGRISDGELHGGYAELRARYADLCGGR